MKHPRPPHRQGLLYAGFGNREKDALAYLASGVPTERVFIIDPASIIRARADMAAAPPAAAAAATPPQWES